MSLFNWFDLSQCGFFWMVLFSPNCTLWYTASLRTNKIRNLLFIVCSDIYIYIFRYSYETQLYRFIEYNCKSIKKKIKLACKRGLCWSRSFLFACFVGWLCLFSSRKLLSFIKTNKQQQQKIIQKNSSQIWQKNSSQICTLSSVITSIVEMFLANKQIPCWFQGRVN